MKFLKYEMILSKCNAVTTCAWMLLSLFPVVIAEDALFNSSSIQTVHRGMSVNISCNYKPSNDSDGFTVELHSNSKLCSVMKSNKSWIKQSCKDHCRFVWIPETVQMSFEVSNLQINDTGTYKCVVTRLIPPPSQLLREEKTFVQVIAPPNVSVSHEGALGQFPTIVCRSEGFYPSALEQMLMRNGEFQNTSFTYSINKINPDGSFTLHSYLNTSDCVNYSCWVNHSTLSQPTILPLTPADCYENRFRGYNIQIALFISALLTPVLLIITAMCCSCEPSEDFLHSELTTEVLYSILSDHHPV
ncbi:major histocompatibility complex class I-related gene protein isoform X2 [Labeo rohita]|uniref:major histocompatibility complex class I-related gene protein isoform X2 n=1 Tax=Labeo rohita TaxID=84645 RepID=UPI0021E2E71A|nr:major histocompatibility complex class I-related gene protein isoform X2 [Labeo rohita]